MLPQEFVHGIELISVDASSIIYLLKIGILGYTAAEIKLITTDNIIKEVGWPHLPIKSYPVENENHTNDESVVDLAVKHHIPVLSEDREVLMNARTHGLNYYNSLMILNYLLLKKRIDINEYSEYLKRLTEISHYSEDILDYGACFRVLVENFLKDY